MKTILSKLKKYLPRPSMVRSLALCWASGTSGSHMRACSQDR